MVELEIVCPVCQGRASPLEISLTFDTGACGGCFSRFVGEYFDGWQSRAQYAAEVIGGYRRVELAYHDEYDYGGPSQCERCGDQYGWTGGCMDYIVLPGGKEITLCHGCYRDWKWAADVYEDGRGWPMSPAVVARFQWRGVEGQQARYSRQQKERKAVEERQGGVCADCGHTPADHLDYLVAWPPEQPEEFVMVCQPCKLRHKEG